MKLVVLASLSAALAVSPAVAQEPQPAAGGTPGGSLSLPLAPGASALKSSNLLNPNISVIGWLQGEAGRRRLDPGTEASPAAQLKEAELGFQSIVDPYARGDFFISVNGEGQVDLEEGYLT